MSIINLDIETIPSQRPGALEEIRAGIQAPGNMSKPETIAAWLRDNADTAAEEKWRKTALDGSQGEIVCIGWAINDEPTRSVFRRLGGDEAEMLRIFYREVKDSGVNHISTIVGHNVKDFDLRFLFQRSVINNVQPSFPLRTESRYGGDFVFDTMLTWAGWGNRISLKNLCKAIGIDAKTGDIDGANLWDAVLAGRYDEICTYCESDVAATREVYKRLTFQGVV
jgi:predicted PolB exonuclease-like 3'-5' exonuclease